MGFDKLFESLVDLVKELVKDVKETYLLAKDALRALIIIGTVLPVLAALVLAAGWNWLVVVICMAHIVCGILVVFAEPVGLLLGSITPGVKGVLGRLGLMFWLSAAIEFVLSPLQVQNNRDLVLWIFGGLVLLTLASAAKGKVVNYFRTGIALIIIGCVIIATVGDWKRIQANLKKRMDLAGETGPTGVGNQPTPNQPTPPPSRSALFCDARRTVCAGATLEASGESRVLKYSAGGKMVVVEIYPESPEPNSSWHYGNEPGYRKLAHFKWAGESLNGWTADEEGNRESRSIVLR